MKYCSTRDLGSAATFAEAVASGLAPDGGLYIPREFPKINLRDFQPGSTLAEIGTVLLAPFVETSFSRQELSALCQAAFDFPTPLVPLSAEISLLELFHGPTAAFKDVGARFLAQCVPHLGKARGPRATVLVATSGDTGGAVAAAFFGQDNLDVFVLYPEGKISARQEQQIACWGGNIKALAVRGDFDDCQRMVKAALHAGNQNSSPTGPNRKYLAANSISLGRLLPQMLYYVQSSLDYQAQTGRIPGFVIPSGNLGNAVAALWAKRLGFPIGKIVLATNANAAITNFFQTGVWQPLPTVATLANAMDVGAPSNVERLFALYPDFQELRQDVQAILTSDTEIQLTIAKGLERYRQIWCPHTATAVAALDKLPQGPWIVVATAHPAKFETVVEPLLKARVPIPESLQKLLQKEPVKTVIGPSLEELQQQLNF